MFSTSKDLLNLSISLAVLLVAFFLARLLFYLIQNLRRLRNIGQGAEKAIDKTNDLLELFKGRLKNGSSHLLLLGKLAEKALDYFKEKKASKKK